MTSRSLFNPPSTSPVVCLCSDLEPLFGIAVLSFFILSPLSHIPFAPGLFVDLSPLCILSHQYIRSFNPPDRGRYRDICI